MLLCEDNILLILSDSAFSIPSAMDIIENLSEMSGYKINWHKSVVMPISVGSTVADFGAYPFTWVPSGRLTTDFQSLVRMNMNPVLKIIKTNFAKWKIINLSLWGEINTVKMMVSSKINYISMMVPMNIPESLIKQYIDIVRDYLWDGKKPRISLNKLFTTRERGGLALPNIELYNISFELRASEGGWLDLERSLTYPFKYIHALSHKPADAHRINPILQHSMDVWNKVHKLLGLSQYKQSYSCIWENPTVKIGKATIFWRTWYDKGIATIKYLFEERVVYLFQDLKKNMLSMVKGTFGNTFSCAGESVLQRFLKLPKMMHSSFIFYKMSANTLYGKSENLRIVWQKDLGIEMGQKM